MTESDKNAPSATPSDQSKSGMDSNGRGGDQAGEPEPNPPRLRLMAQYIKDLSFENPAVPESLSAAKDGPKIDVSVDVHANRRSNTDFEVVLKLNATAKKNDDVIFITELVYGGLFQITNVPDEQLQPIVLIECPRLIFPFARRVLADTTRDGGFPPLLIDPIDFMGLYQQQMAAAQQQAAANPET